MDAPHIVHLVVVGLVFLTCVTLWAIVLRKNGKTKGSWVGWLLMIAVASIVLGGKFGP